MADGGTRGSQPFLAACLAFFAGCTSLADHRYGPSPQDHELREKESDATIARVQVASRGIQKRGSGTHAFRFRLRIENPLGEPIRLERGLFQLVEGTLTAFATPEIVSEPPSSSDVIDPGAAAVFDVSFPFPSDPDALDLSSVNFRWGIAFPRGTVAASAFFERLVPRSAGYAPYPYYGYRGPHYTGFGVGFHFGN